MNATYPFKRIYRNQTSSILTGVCSGLSDFFLVNVAFIRFIFILLLFFNLSSAILYLLFTAIMPLQNAEKEFQHKETHSILFYGMSFLLIGSYILLDYFKFPFLINIWSLSFYFSVGFLFFILGFFGILIKFNELETDTTDKSLSLKKNTEHRMISGVLCGLADHIKVDATMLRLLIITISVLLIKISLILLLIYLILVNKLK